jgi:outer membrane receptor for ferrienterochelin and colicin
MKKLLIPAFTLMAFVAFGQSETPVVSSKGVTVVHTEIVNNMPIKKPLLVIDNVIQDVKNVEEFDKKVNTIEPNTIEKMDILKGEQAISKYGDKGANGVIEIILKKQ